MWNFLKFNTILNLTVILEILLQDLLLCDLITLSTQGFKHIDLVKKDIQPQKVSGVCFAKNVIKTLYVPIVILFLDRESNLKCLQ